MTEFAPIEMAFMAFIEAFQAIPQHFRYMLFKCKHIWYADRFLASMGYEVSKWLSL